MNANPFLQTGGLFEMAPALNLGTLLSLDIPLSEDLPTMVSAGN